MFSNRTGIIVVLIFIFLPAGAGFSQSIITSGQTSGSSAPAPSGTTPLIQQQQTIADRARNLTYQFELKPKLIDISLVSGFTLRSSQMMFELGIQAGVFLNAYLELGGKFGFESLNTYGNLFEANVFARVYLLKSGETMPFFQMDAGAGLGKKLKGFVLRPGFGMLQHIKDAFNIYLMISYDIWFFTYRFNSDDVISYDAFLIGKVHTDFRVVFGLTFFFNR